MIKKIIVYNKKILIIIIINKTIQRQNDKLNKKGNKKEIK